MSPPSGASPASQGKWQPLQNAATPWVAASEGSTALVAPLEFAGGPSHHLLRILGRDTPQELLGGAGSKDGHHGPVMADRHLTRLPDVIREPEIGRQRVFPAQEMSRPRLAKRVNSGWKVISTVPVAPERCFSMINSAIPFFS